MLRCERTASRANRLRPYIHRPRIKYLFLMTALVKFIYRCRSCATTWSHWRENEIALRTFNFLSMKKCCEIPIKSKKRYCHLRFKSISIESLLSKLFTLLIDYFQHPKDTIQELIPAPLKISPTFNEKCNS